MSNPFSQYELSQRVVIIKDGAAAEIEAVVKSVTLTVGFDHGGDQMIMSSIRCPELGWSIRPADLHDMDDEMLLDEINRRGLGDVEA